MQHMYSCTFRHLARINWLLLFCTIQQKHYIRRRNHYLKLKIPLPSILLRYLYAKSLNNNLFLEAVLLVRWSHQEMAPTCSYSIVNGFYTVCLLAIIKYGIYLYFGLTFFISSLASLSFS